MNVGIIKTLCIDLHVLLFCTLQVAEQQKKAHDKSIPVRQMDPKKKASYLSAIGDYHAAMNILSGGPHDSILDVYGFEQICILADEKDTPTTALSKALL